LAKSDKPRTNVITWIAFVAASLMILLLASSTLNYSLGISSITLFDEVGAALPYALIVAIITYYLLKSSKPKGIPAGQLAKSAFRVDAFLLLIVGGVLVGVLLFILFFIPSPLGGMPVLRPPGTTTGAYGQNSLNLPSLDLLSLLTIFMIVFPIVAVLLATVLTKKADVVENPADELEIAKDSWNGEGGTIDDEYRRTIIANYLRGRELMVNQGVQSTEVMTPREFESGVLQSLKTAGGDFLPLSRLFEEARFSIHAMGQGERIKSEKHRKRLEELGRELNGDEN
jgi:hypothetical protein